jgi:hypothetical protein
MQLLPRRKTVQIIIVNTTDSHSMHYHVHLYGHEKEPSRIIPETKESD